MRHDSSSATARQIKAARRKEIDKIYREASEDIGARWRLVKQLWLSGLSLIPIIGNPTEARDNFKVPAVDWTKFKHEPPTQRELIDLFHGRKSGIAIVCGAVSGNLEVLDVEDILTWKELKRLLSSAEFNEPDLLKKLPIVRTPGHVDGKGGYHAYFRLPFEPNLKGDREKKLAKRLIDGKPRTIIEIRGGVASDYVLAPGSPARCHESARRYRMWQGDLLNIPTITDVQYVKLLEASKLLNEVAPVDRERFFDRPKRPLPSGLPDPMDYWQIVLADKSLTPTGSSGEWLKALCPLPDHDDTRRSLNVRVDGGFNCHGCGAKGGNILQFHELLLCEMDYVEVLADLRSMVG